VTLQYFDKCVVDFFGPLNLPTKRSGGKHIITTINYLTIWDETEPVKDCGIKTFAQFLFENVVTRFGFHRILMSD
jgi:hypothetical protein